MVVVDMNKSADKFFKALLMKVLASLSATFVVWLMKTLVSLL